MKTDKELFFTIFENRTLTHVSACNFTAYAQILLDKHFSSAQKIKKHIQLGKTLLNKSKRVVKKISLNQGIREFRKEFNVINEHFSIMPWIALELWQEQFDSIVQKAIIENNLQDKQEEIIYAISKPWKKTALAQLQEEIGKTNTSSLLQKYQFLREWSIIWYREINHEWLSKIPPLQKKQKQTLSFKSAMKYLNLNDKEKKIIENAPYLIYFKDYRDDIRREHVYIWHSYFEKVAELLKVDIKELGYFSLDEIELFINQKAINHNLLKSRKTETSIITYDLKNKKIVIHNKIATKKYEKIIEEVKTNSNTDSGVKEIKGISATNGVVQGRAFIIKTFHDCKRITSDDILIANSTHPNYLSAMQKAKAFVTNEGGIICHAAIVAREMKKPCVVGTKIATQIFKEGDIIEVNANTGIVKKI